MENEVLKCLKTRRSIRSFKPTQIKVEELDAILEAGTYAPTAMNLQSPLIVAVQNKEDVDLLNRLSLEVMGRNPRPGTMPYYGAPTIVIIFATKRARNPLLGTLDASSVTTNMLNAAHSLGLGSIWINRSKEIFESEEGKKLLNKWGIEEEVEGVASIALGYIEGEYPETKPRREGYILKIK